MNAACGGFLRVRLLKHYVWVLMVKKYFSPAHMILVAKGKELHSKNLCFSCGFICCYMAEGLES